MQGSLEAPISKEKVTKFLMPDIFNLYELTGVHLPSQWESKFRLRSVP